MKQTAREFYDAHYSDDAVVMMIEFAKLHVEAALKEASEKAIVNTEPDYRGGEWSIVDTDSILNAYPLENIK
jgi:hypothetical protein